MKLVIDISEGALELLNTKGVDWLDAEHILSAVAHGISLDSVKAEIDKLTPWVYKSEVLGILDDIGKADMKGKSCNTCKNSDDEFSGECYECVKGIFDHYESEDV